MPKANTTNHEPRTADLLFEIGTEEVPAAYVPSLIAQLRDETQSLFEAHHLSFRQIESFGTPRRLVLLVRGLGSTQHKPGEEVRGPSKQASYDKAGKPAQALLGFLRSQGGTLEQVKLVSSEKGEYLYLVKPPRTTQTSTILPGLLPQLVGSLRAPKTMRWDPSGVRFARPIRWLLALYGSTPITCVLGTLKTGSATWVGRPLKPRRINVRSCTHYFKVMEQCGVLLDHNTRRRWIQNALTYSAKQAGGQPAAETATHGLLDEVTYLVESPGMFVGSYDRTYLGLPREVLLASMAKHQRVFAVEEKSGKLLPTFIAVRDDIQHQTELLRSGKIQLRASAMGNVKRTYERILNARLADSLMFWEEDRNQPIEQTARALSGVTFHERLGSMADKSQRLATLSTVLEEAWGLSSSETKELRRACQLAKADLVSTMVKEFPTLQGVMGKYYAQHAGEPPSVCRAIEEHYLPAGQAGLPIGDRLPQTLLGSALAILDKYDTLSSYFAQGIVPTGDQDPFGLRRAAQGIVEVAWTMHRPLPLDRLLQARAAIQPFLPKTSSDPAAAIQETGARITRYLFERLYTFAWPAPKPATDYIDAVLSSPCQDLVDVMDRIRSLRGLDGKPGLLKAAKVIERTRNILKGATVRQRQVESSRLTEPPERRLWELYSSNKERVERLVQEKSYDEATVVFGDVFFAPLHEFFDRVLVNTPEESLQQNRLALMQAINTLYTERIADLSKLTILQQREESR